MSVYSESTMNIARSARFEMIRHLSFVTPKDAAVLSDYNGPSWL